MVQNNMNFQYFIYNIKNYYEKTNPTLNFFILNDFWN